jgi:hypothetical protein
MNWFNYTDFLFLNAIFTRFALKFQIPGWYDPGAYQSSSVRTLTVLPFTFPADNFFTATRATLRATAT